MKPRPQDAAPSALFHAVSTRPCRRSLAGDHQHTARAPRVMRRQKSTERHPRRTLRMAVEIKNGVNRQPPAPRQAVEAWIASGKRMLGASGHGPARFRPTKQGRTLGGPTALWLAWFFSTRNEGF